ncbi:MAG: hypothetical protein B7Y99_02650 [Caulobacterales bacterium 32-69-10]|nr:MAG: hypothetical protein B7Y99_02650 [Caulobacterales bacterium 32-69-10]
MISSASALRFDGSTMTAKTNKSAKRDRPADQTTLAAVDVDQRSADFIAAGLAGASSPQALAAHRTATKFFVIGSKAIWGLCLIAFVWIGLEAGIVAGVAAALFVVPFCALFSWVWGKIGAGNQQVQHEMKKRGLI